MISERVPETLPISSLNALEYCQRRFYYQFVQSDMLINEFVLEGTLVHRRAHQPGRQTTAEGGNANDACVPVQRRTAPVWFC